MLKSLLDPVLNRIKKDKSRAYPFKGVYKKLSDVPVINDGYHNDGWLKTIFNDVIIKLNTIKKTRFILPAEQRNNVTNLLPLLVSTLAQPNNKVSILDFGGGMGAGYLDCLKCLSNIEYIFHVIDTAPNNEYANKIYQTDSNIKFYDIDIPDDLPKINIINLGSSLQYVDDYNSTLKDLIRINSEYIFFSDTFMGEMSTFATMQVNMKGKGIPCWIFNYQEIIDFFQNNKYELVYKSSNYQPFHDLSNFPSGFKLKDSYNLLFINKNFKTREKVY